MIQQKHSPVPHSGQEKKKKKILDLAERGKSNDIAHCPIVQVLPVLNTSQHGRLSHGKNMPL